MRAPVMLMLKGHPGSGKSTLAAQLAKQLSCPLVDKDDARDCLTALRHDAAALNAVAYAIMFRVAARQLQCGHSVIVDSPLSRVETWQMACRLAAQHGAVPVLVEVQPPPEDVWRARIEQRAAREGATDAGHKPDWQKLQALIAGYSNCFMWPLTVVIQHHILVDASNTDVGDATSHASDQAQYVIRQLQHQGLLEQPQASSQHQQQSAVAAQGGA